MKVKELITRLLDEPMEAEVCLQDPTKHITNGIMCSGYLFDITYIEPWNKYRICINFNDWRKTEPQNCEECPQYKFSDDRGYYCDDEPQTSGTPYEIEISSVCKTEPQYDFGEYADRLWKIAYERGKREALEQTEPQTDCADTNLSEKPTDSTRSKMEQVDKDINVRSKAVYDKWGNVFDARADIDDEPQTDDFQDWKDQMWAEAVIAAQTERSE